MSTRCQIEFKHIAHYLKKKKPMIQRRTVYRHSDGYPKGVIPDLKEFLKWNNGRNGDIEYQAANFIYWSKRHYEEDYFNKNFKTNKIEDPKLKWSDLQETNCSQLHIGFGICENDEIHGDVAYFYEVVRESTETGKYESTIKTYIKVYDLHGQGQEKKLLQTIEVQNEK